MIRLWVPCYQEPGSHVDSELRVGSYSSAASKCHPSRKHSKDYLTKHTHTHYARP